MRGIGGLGRAARRLTGGVRVAPPGLTATPNPVPVGANGTTIAWSTGDGSVGQVWVSEDGRPEALFGGGASGSAVAPWIAAGSEYEFRLYAGTARTAPLESVSVTREAAPRRRSKVSFGSLRRLTPISRVCGFDRGLPIDRYYIESFLTRHADDIRGRVLEIGGDSYTRRFGRGRVSTSDVLNLDEANPKATIIGDVTRADHIPSEAFDCIVFTQTLQYIYDARAAILTLHRILKPGGVLLATCPGISQISLDESTDYWCWGFTSLSARRLFEEAFPATNISVEAHGNVFAAIAFLHGLAADELSREELDHRDSLYQVSITVRAVRDAGI
jgi:SAM-dependent methyltransferase